MNSLRYIQPNRNNIGFTTSSQRTSGSAAWAQIAVLLLVQRLYDDQCAAGLDNPAEAAFFTRLLTYLTALESS